MEHGREADMRRCSRSKYGTNSSVRIRMDSGFFADLDPDFINQDQDSVPEPDPKGQCCGAGAGEKAPAPGCCRLA